jgi:hypothetical protein
VGNITLLDMLGAALIAGFLLMIVSFSNARMNETLFTTGNDLVVQEELVTLVRTVEKDFRRIGYCRDQVKIPDQSKAIIAAGPSSLSFQTDVDNDGIVDTLSYYLGSVADLSVTPNPRDRMLYRKLNGYGALPMNIGLTCFTIHYFDINNDSIATPVADPSAIHQVEIDVRLESTRPYNETYSYVAWRQLRLRSRNVEGR